MEFKEREKWREETFVPYEKRKKILLLSDDLRLPSGVGTVSKDIVLKTIHHFNWVQVGGAIKHPDQGKIVDMSQELDRLLGIGKSYMRIYPTSGYGDPDLIRYLINEEKPDAIMHFTDPRFWIWLYQMEHEIRQVCPLLFYHVWDDLPFPMYNQNYYESCDTISCISKQTYNIVKNVRERLPIEDWALQYIPHGINHDLYKPITIDNPGNQIKRKIKEPNKPEREIGLSEFEDMLEFKKKIFGGKEYDFVAFYNNRNIRRKMPGDVILGFAEFVKMLPKDKRNNVALLMHTHVVDENGTDLMAVKNAVAKDCNILFSADKLDQTALNYLYNIVDVTINMASNEGYGLATAESLMAGTPIIANVTGGLQDQMGFVDENGELLDPDKHYHADWGSNHDGKYKKHGKWVKPLFPTNRALVGSPPTPYIFDDRCDWMDAAKALKYWYDQGEEKRTKAGLIGRQYMFDTGMTANGMGLRFIDYIDTSMKKFTPRKRFTVYEL